LPARERQSFHHFERFVAEYEERFEKAYGYFRPIIKEVVQKYLDCGMRETLLLDVPHPK